MIRTLTAAVIGLLILGSPGGASAKEPNVMIVAGGCFWCVESDFDKVPGVLSTQSGYTGGLLINPTYKQVTRGGSGHLEAVRIEFDPAKTDFATLLEIYWRTVDPTDGGGQFCDRGESYTTAIFAVTPEQKQLAEASKAAIEKSGVLDDPIETQILYATPFYPAEDYHQDYHTKSPIRYRVYRYNCGRDKRVKAIWGDQAYRGVPGH